MDRLSALAELLRREHPGVALLENEPMSAHTSFKAGGPARLMALPCREEEAAAVLRAAAALEVEPFFLGNGSNLLVADGGYDGLIVKLSGLDKVEDAGDGRLRAGAAIPLARLAAGVCLDRGLTGLEFASGIPGTLGGAVVMNAGAYGGELCQVVTRVAYLDKTGEKHVISRENCQFSYRHSVFCAYPDRLIVGAELALAPGDRGAIKARLEELAAARRAKQPLEWPSAGSTFKRPAPVNGEPRYAAALIDQCGLKGLTVGGAQVSEKHGGFIINRGGATAADILTLMDRVRETVLRETGVELEPEVRLLGFGR